jgi:hypothetical protein
MSDLEAMIAAIREAVREALDHVGMDVIRNGEFFGINQTSATEGEE